MSNKTVDEHRFRIVLYCHNRIGLGHIIRSIRIATQLASTKVFEPILLTGCRSLGSIAVPDNLQVYQLTPIPADSYDPYYYNVLTERVAQIHDCIKTLSPDILLVDTLPLGYMKELKGVLESASKRDKGSPICVLGLPYANQELKDIVKNANDHRAFSSYKYGMIYSDENPDVVYKEIPFPLTNVGIVAGPPPPPPNYESKTILVLAGGGAVSLSLLEPLVNATAQFREQGFAVRFVIGPLADIDEMTKRMAGIENFELIATCSVEDALMDAKIVISRCGYNTAATLARSALPIVFIPYCHSETDEQYTRAERLSGMNNIVIINPLKGNLSLKLTTAISSLLHLAPEARELSGSFSGSENAAEYLLEVAEQLARINRTHINHNTNIVQTPE